MPVPSSLWRRKTRIRLCRLGKEALPRINQRRSTRIEATKCKRWKMALWMTKINTWTFKMLTRLIMRLLIQVCNKCKLIYEAPFLPCQNLTCQEVKVITTGKQDLPKVYKINLTMLIRWGSPSSSRKCRLLAYLTKKKTIRWRVPHL